MASNKIITRFAPSPTGYLHIGGARTALFNHLFTKKLGGKVILRIEDTDKLRSTPEYEASIIDSLKWLNISYDQTFKQSEREEVYKKYLKKLIDEDKAYISKETPSEEDKENPDFRLEVIRFRNPGKKVTFTDLIRGEITFDTTELKDFVIAKSLEEPLYHLAVAVDDFEMGITHVVRGDDHISNTPRQILIQEAIGAPRPIYAHLPIILATDKSKLSKRKHGEAVSLNFYRDRGYIPEAIVNFMALLGWNPGTDQELFSIDGLVQIFDITKVQKGGAVFNTEKLDWINRQYIGKMSDTEFTTYIEKYIPSWLDISRSQGKKIIPLLKEKIVCFSDIPKLFDREGELHFVKEISAYQPTLLLWKKNPDPATAKKHLDAVKVIIGNMTVSSDDEFTPEAIKNAIWSYVEANGKGDVLWPLRVALTGQERSPDPFISASILGKTETLQRLLKAIAVV